jgi:hypothetical protein
MMVEPHFSARLGPEFSVNIEADPLNEEHFRWEIREGGRIHLRSPHAYASWEEAETESATALKKFLADWRSQ